MKNEEKKEEEQGRKEKEREEKLDKLPQEISKSIKTALGIKTTLADEIVAAYKRLKAQDEEESAIKEHKEDNQT
jgi:hypothetical protein